MADNTRKRLAKKLDLEKVDSISEGLRKFKTKEGLYGFIDAETNEIKIPAQFQRATHFVRGRALVEKDGKRYSINRNGHTINSEGKLPYFVTA